MKLQLLLFWLTLLAWPLMAQADKVDDIRVLIDVSGSMVKTDPHNLRVPALRLLTGLIPSGSKAGVWTFGRYTNMEVKWGTVNDRWRKQAKAGASRVHSRGQFTNIEGAIKRASSSWKKADKNTNRSLILLTDGKVDVSKNNDKNLASRQRVLDKTIPDLIKRGIRIYTIALSDRTDEALLKRLALKTSGSFERADNARDLQRIFLHMFERAARPDTVPLKGNKFTIDKSIREMTLLVFRKGDKATRLIEPGGTIHSDKKHGGKVKWNFEQGYDLITVKKPSPGKWLLDADIDPDNRVMIVTDLKLQVDDIPAYITPDQSINIKLELHNKNKKISKKSFLKFVDFKMTHRFGDQTQTRPLQLKKSREIKDKGIYLQQVKPPLNEGTHTFILQAEARTFKRSKRVSVEVQWPVKVDIDKTAKPGIYQLKISPREEYIRAPSLRLAVSLKSPKGDTQKIKLMQQDTGFGAIIAANQQDGLYHLLIHFQAKNIEGQEVQHDLQPYPVLGVKIESPAVVDETPSRSEAEKETASQTEIVPAPAVIQQEPVAPPPESDWLKTLIIIGAANLLLILIGAGLWVFMRKRNAIAQIETLYDEEDHKAASDTSGEDEK